MTTGFKDLFSGLADTYAAARPGYPEVLFDLLVDAVGADARVWEPGCGSGQATRGLAARFAHVHATEASAQQLARHWAASGAANITLACEPAEQPALPDASVQLVAVAQALHWFDRPRFFAECERVLQPGGVLAAWGYRDFIAPEGMEAAVDAFRQDIEPYWMPERDEIDAEYAGYDWPFPAVPAPSLWHEADWSLAQLLGYLRSMSAVSRYAAQNGRDPVSMHEAVLGAEWGDADARRVIRWPLFVHLRRKPA